MVARQDNRKLFRSAQGWSFLARAPWASRRRRAKSGRIGGGNQNISMMRMFFLLLVGIMFCSIGLGEVAMGQGNFGSGEIIGGGSWPDTKSTEKERPLYDQDPYDLITLNQKNEGKVLKVVPLKFRQEPKFKRPSSQFRVVLLDEPDKEYDLKWSAVERIDFFEELVLAKAIELARQEDPSRRDEAFDYFRWLEEKAPKLPGFKQALEGYLFVEARTHFQQHRPVAALAVLGTLYDRNPNYPKLDTLFGAVVDQLIERYNADNDYASMRKLARSLNDRFRGHPIAVKWENDLRSRAGNHLETARRAAERGNFRKADHAMRQIIHIWPDLPGANEMITLLHRRYPRVVVGVTSPVVSVNPNDRRDWAARRDSRLIYRTLTEFLGPGSEGGIYYCPVGSIDIEPLQHRLRIQLKPGQRWSKGNATLSGADVARKLLAMAEPANKAYVSAWSELFAGATVHDVYRVDVDMQRPHVRPDALLQTTLPPDQVLGAKNSPVPTNGGYLIDSQSPGQTVFVYNRQYFDDTPTRPKEIVERYFDDDRLAARALRDGQIKVLDRLNPWTLDVYRSLENVQVEPYAVPLVHCLIPNQNKPLMKKAIFRRALVYGIPRHEILTKRLLGDKPLPGCRVVSGPFPQGDSYDDPLGYAYDSNIEPLPYEPELAVLLSSIAVDAVKAEQAKKEAEANGQTKAPEDQTPPPENPTANGSKKEVEKKKIDHKFITKITIAHPPNEIARTACEEIKEQLKKIGIVVTLKQLRPGPIDRVPDDADLLYAELPMWEPVVDARELLGPGGLSGETSAYMNLTLRQLRYATDWQQIQPLLRQIHGIAHNDVAVVPLWQLTDYYAFHTSLRRIGDRPVSLYQNVEQWLLTIPTVPDGGTSEPVGKPFRLAGQRNTP